MKIEIDPMGALNEIKSGIISKAQDFDAMDIIYHATKAPGVKVQRTKFLRKELKNRFSVEIVNLAIEKNPAYAGITREVIDEISKNVINYETNKVSTISFAAGIPGGLAYA